LTRPQAEAPAHRYQKILFDPESADQLLAQLFVESQTTAPESLVLDLDGVYTNVRVTSRKVGASF
jgi:hypothetical protein